MTMTEYLTQKARPEADSQCANRPSGSAVRSADGYIKQRIWRRLSLYVFVVAAALALSLSESVQAQQIKTLEDAASEVRARHEGAQILKAQPRVRSDGSKIFRFRLLTKDGMVKTIKISPDGEQPANDKTRKKKQRK